MLIRPIGPEDFDLVRAMFEAMSPDNVYLRFFNFSTRAAEAEAKRICRTPEVGRVALLALADGELVGVASYTGVGGSPERAEVAFAVADHMHHKGIATLLLEHLVSLAVEDHIITFTAQTLTENTAMLRVFTSAGLPVHRHTADGIVDLTIPLSRDGTGTGLDNYLNAVAERERHADAASLRHLLAPESIAVIGASRRQGTVGRAVLDNIRDAGYTGQVYAVNPHARQIGGKRCLASPGDLPEHVDLAVIAVPAIGLDATFASRHPMPGTAGLVMQSGGLGLAMASQLSKLGIGISSFASVGDKLDVSSNDLLMWWEQDRQTKLAVLYIESFGNPRKFARTARRVGASMPVLAVQAGRSAAGQRAAASHTAAVATPLVTRQALFQQAGLIAVPGFGELIEIAALLATQPIPAGSTVAIVSNVGGAGVLAADACTDNGLTVYQPHGLSKRRLHALIPETGTADGPIDTTAAIPADQFRQVLELAAADEEVSSMIALALPTAATGDLVTAIQQADIRVPLAAVLLEQTETVRLLPSRGGHGRIPAYAYPEAAAAALARAASYGAWRTGSRGVVPKFDDIDPGHVRALIREFLSQAPGGGWMPGDQAAELLRCYGIALVPLAKARNEDDAVAAFETAAAEAGQAIPVVLKADVPGLVHKTDAGGVELDLRATADVRAAYRRLAERFAGRLRRVLVQPMIKGGTEVIVGVTDDHIFGPLVVFGLGGVATEILADHSARLTPLTDTDADTLIRSIQSAPLLLGHRGSPAADLGALRDLLLRVARLADDLPEITDLDLNPVIARPDGAFAVDARVKVTPYQPKDPFLRDLR